MKMNDIESTPLYIFRPLLNGEEVREWARTQGFETTLEPEDMHVTVVYSQTPFSPTEVVGGEVLADEHDRAVEHLGDGGAVVLKFESSILQDEWQQYQDMGASHGFDNYITHVTITYEGEDLDVEGMEPFLGNLQFGAGKSEELEMDGENDYEES